MHTSTKIIGLLIPAAFVCTTHAHGQLVKKQTHPHVKIVPEATTSASNEVCYNPNLILQPLVDTTQLQNVIPIIRNESIPFPINSMKTFDPNLVTPVYKPTRIENHNTEQSATHYFKTTTLENLTGQKTPHIPNYRLKPYTENKRKQPTPSATQIKYITILYTREISFQVNPTLDITQSFHFTPDSNKTFGMDVGIILHIK